MHSFSCLMYHNVCADGSLADPHSEWARLSPSVRSYFVEETGFASQLAALNGTADLITLDRVRKYFRNAGEGSRPLDLRPSVLLTFDDGWSGTLDRAVPILRQYAAEATVFVTTGFLDRPGFLRSSDLQRLPPELQLGSHGLTHRFLNELTEMEIRDELRTSRRVLEDLSGREVDTVGIPNGAIDDRVTRIAEEEGYSLLFHSEVHINSQWTGPFSIGRVAIRSGTPDDRVQVFAQGEFGLDPVRRLMLGIPKRILGPERYRRWRSWWLGEQSGQKEMQDLIHPGATSPGESVATSIEVCESR